MLVMRLLVHKSALISIKEKLAGVDFQAGGLLWTQDSPFGQSGKIQAAVCKTKLVINMMGVLKSVTRRCIRIYLGDQVFDTFQRIEQEMLQKASRTYIVDSAELATMVVQRATGLAINSATGLAFW